MTSTYPFGGGNAIDLDAVALGDEQQDLVRRDAELRTAVDARLACGWCTVTSCGVTDVAGVSDVQSTVDDGADVVDLGLFDVVVQIASAVGNEQRKLRERGVEVLVRVRVQQVAVLAAMPSVPKGNAEPVLLGVVAIKHVSGRYWLPW